MKNKSKAYQYNPNKRAYSDAELAARLELFLGFSGVFFLVWMLFKGIS